MKTLSSNQMEALTSGKKMVDPIGCALGVASMMVGFISLGALTGGLSFAAASAILSYGGGFYSVVTTCKTV